MLKRFILSLLWAAAFFVASLILLLSGFFVLGLYSSMTGGPSGITFSQLWKFTPLLGAFVGFALGLLGRLPGTSAHRAR
jgi:hypothetical protein